MKNSRNENNPKSIKIGLINFDACRDDHVFLGSNGVACDNDAFMWRGVLHQDLRIKLPTPTLMINKQLSIKHLTEIHVSEQTMLPRPAFEME